MPIDLIEVSFVTREVNQCQPLEKYYYYRRSLTDVIRFSVLDFTRVRDFQYLLGKNPMLHEIVSVTRSEQPGAFQLISSLSPFPSLLLRF